MKEIETSSQNPEVRIKSYRISREENSGWRRACSVQNISYPVTRFTSWPVISCKIQDKTVGYVFLQFKMSLRL
ncbi:hypothetical protein ES708_13234 [subsurface metagenome]